jgi:hypothetical protein
VAPGRPWPPTDEREPIVVERVEYASYPAFTEEPFLELDRLVVLAVVLR